MATQTPEPNEFGKPTSTNLTLEQQFSLLNYVNSFQKANDAQKTDIFKSVLTHFYGQQNYYKELVKQNWGIEKPDVIDKRPTEEECTGDYPDY